MSIFGESTTTTVNIKAIHSRTGIDEYGTPYIELYEDVATAKKLKRLSESAKRGWETRRANVAYTLTWTTSCAGSVSPEAISSLIRFCSAS